MNYTVYVAHMHKNIRTIAFYLPQFHPIPENDEWWGKGFTEWRNVAKAKPLFPGHYQPHIPTDLGFYDLRLPEARQAQADLARQYGIHGFCYYHYWFNGRRILERPFNEVLASGEPDLPFCLCWANENWTRRWDGLDSHVLLHQAYNHEDDLNHIESLIPAFRDDRYIRINGKPLFLVYRAEFLPDPIRTTEIWREAARKAGIDDLYLVRVLEHKTSLAHANPESIGFDAEVEFPPFSWSMGNVKFTGSVAKLMTKLRLLPKGLTKNKVIDYNKMAQGMLSLTKPEWTRFHCVTPSWDNSARKDNASIFLGSTPEQYEAWLRKITEQTIHKRHGDERIVFINAWNEWAEGNHLEPDLKWGHAYLEATKKAITLEFPIDTDTVLPAKKQDIDRKDPGLKKAYWKLNQVKKEMIDLLQYILFRRRQ